MDERRCRGLRWEGQEEEGKREGGMEYRRGMGRERGGKGTMRVKVKVKLFLARGN